MAVWSGANFFNLQNDVETRNRPAREVMREIRDFATSHSAWTQAEYSTDMSVDIVNPKGAVSSNFIYDLLVLRCDGAQNAAGKDFYVSFVSAGTQALNAQTGARTGTLALRDFNVSVSEGYPESGVLSRPAPGPDLELTAPAPDGSAGGGTGYPIVFESSPKTKKPAINDQTIWSKAARLSGLTRFRMAIYVTNNTLAFFIGPTGAAGTQGNLVSVGLFQSLMDQDPMPLYLSNGSEARITRMPFVVAGQPDNWKLRQSVDPGQRWTNASGVLNQGGDLLHSGRPISSRLTVLHRGRSETHGGLRGVFYDYSQFLSGFPPQIGDILVIEGNPMGVISTRGTGAAGAVGTTTVVNLASP